MSHKHKWIKGKIEHSQKVIITYFRCEECQFVKVKNEPREEYLRDSK